MKKKVFITFEIDVDLSTDAQTLVSASVEGKHCVTFMSKHGLEEAIEELCDSGILQRRIVDELRSSSSFTN